MNILTIVTTLAAICTTFCYLPQVIQSWKTKKTEDLSMPMLLTFVMGMLFWFWAGLLLKNIPMILANSISAILAFSLVILKIKYGKKKI